MTGLLTSHLLRRSLAAEKALPRSPFSLGRARRGEHSPSAPPLQCVARHLGRGARKVLRGGSPRPIFYPHAVGLRPALRMGRGTIRDGRSPCMGAMRFAVPLAGQPSFLLLHGYACGPP